MAGPYGDVHLTTEQAEGLRKQAEELDQGAEEARQAGDHMQLVTCFEQGLHVRRQLFLESSAEVAQACRRLCEACNAAATTLLQQDNLKGAHELLKRAEQVAERNASDRAITWNNLACYSRRAGKPRSAVTFLERALQVEERTGSADVAQTHLNLCATLSQLKRHVDALHHAQCALIRVFENVTSESLLRGQPLDEGRFGRPNESVTVLCIAYHNIAVEHEFLRNYDAAMSNYVEGLRWAARFLSETHQLFGILRSSVETVKAKLPPDSPACRRAEAALDRLSDADRTQVQFAQSDLGPAGNLITPRDSGEFESGVDPCEPQ
jgi:tetratricopeptide (TPR) repeat protein